MFDKILDSKQYVYYCMRIFVDCCIRGNSFTSGTASKGHHCCPMHKAVASFCGTTISSYIEQRYSIAFPVSHGAFVHLYSMVPLYKHPLYVVFM